MAPLKKECLHWGGRGTVLRVRSQTLLFFPHCLQGYCAPRKKGLRLLEISQNGWRFALSIDFTYVCIIYITDDFDANDGRTCRLISYCMATHFVHILTPTVLCTAVGVNAVPSRLSASVLKPSGSTAWSTIGPH